MCQKVFKLCDSKCTWTVSAIMVSSAEMTPSVPLGHHLLLIEVREWTGSVRRCLKTLLVFKALERTRGFFHFSAYYHRIICSCIYQDKLRSRGRDIMSEEHWPFDLGCGLLFGIMLVHGLDCRESRPNSQPAGSNGNDGPNPKTATCAKDAPITNS